MSDNDMKSAHAPASKTEMIDFGFQSIARDAKQGKVRGVFDSVADKYDVMNDAMSAGLHRLWKARMIECLHLRPRADLSMVDVAGGTGDIAFRALARADKIGSRLRAQVIDANEQMVRVGRRRAANDTDKSSVGFITGTAEALPLPDASADLVSIAFGIRNVTDRDAALRDMYRVLKPGGRFVCLEFSHMPSRVLQNIYDAYSFNLIPPMGGLIAGERDAYQYLVESIRRFPKPQAFSAQLADAGFERVQYELMSGGIAALHMGWKL